VKAKGKVKVEHTEHRRYYCASLELLEQKAALEHPRFRACVALRMRENLTCGSSRGKNRFSDFVFNIKRTGYICASTKRPS
jgi:hypothetical protein